MLRHLEDGVHRFALGRIDQRTRIDNEDLGFGGVARQLMTGFAPSSPSIALFRDGKLVYMVERRDIEQRTAEGIADLLTLAFDKHCA